MAKYQQPRAGLGVSVYVQNVSQLKSFECGIHDLTYRAIRAGCPACDFSRQANQLRAALKEVNGQVELLSKANQQMRVNLDVTEAMRDAVELLDDGDLVFFKEVLYEYRDRKSVNLRTTHGARGKKKERPPANGFIVIPRKGDPYGYLCTSIGGAAMAEYYEEASNIGGSIYAMNMLVRVMANHLPGSVK